MVLSTYVRASTGHAADQYRRDEAWDHVMLRNRSTCCASDEYKKISYEALVSLVSHSSSKRSATMPIKERKLCNAKAQVVCSPSTPIGRLHHNAGKTIIQFRHRQSCIMPYGPPSAPLPATSSYHLPWLSLSTSATFASSSTTAPTLPTNSGSPPLANT